MEPAALGDELRATATVIRRGSTLVTVEGEVLRIADNTRVAYALGTLAVMNRQK